MTQKLENKYVINLQLWLMGGKKSMYFWKCFFSVLINFHTCSGTPCLSPKNRFHLIQTNLISLTIIRLHLNAVSLVMKCSNEMQLAVTCSYCKLLQVTASFKPNLRIEGMHHHSAHLTAVYSIKISANIQKKNCWHHRDEIPANRCFFQPALALLQLVHCRWCVVYATQPITKINGFAHRASTCHQCQIWPFESNIRSGDQGYWSPGVFMLVSQLFCALCTSTLDNPLWNLPRSATLWLSCCSS